MGSNPDLSDEQKQTLFVSGITDQVDEELLFELFINAGPLIRVHIPVDRDSKRQKTFAFVRFQHEESVPYACNLFKDVKLCGRNLVLQNKATGAGMGGSGNNHQRTTSAPQPMQFKPPIQSFQPQQQQQNNLLVQQQMLLMQQQHFVQQQQFGQQQEHQTLYSRQVSGNYDQRAQGHHRDHHRQSNGQDQYHQDYDNDSRSRHRSHERSDSRRQEQQQHHQHRHHEDNRDRSHDRRDNRNWNNQGNGGGGGGRHRR